MKTLKSLLLYCGILLLFSVGVCVIRSDYRDIGSGLTITLLVWAGYFATRHVLKKRDATCRPAQGPRCQACRSPVQGRDSLIASQIYAVQAGLSKQAREMESNQGYVCQKCGSLYCKTCLEHRVVNPQTGATCPRCGGRFGYLA